MCVYVCDCVCACVRVCACASGGASWGLGAPPPPIRQEGLGPAHVISGIHRCPGTPHTHGVHGQGPDRSEAPCCHLGAPTAPWGQSHWGLGGVKEGGSCGDTAEHSRRPVLSRGQTQGQRDAVCEQQGHAKPPPPNAGQGGWSGQDGWPRGHEGLSQTPIITGWASSDHLFPLSPAPLPLRTQDHACCPLRSEDTPVLGDPEVARNCPQAWPHIQDSGHDLGERGTEPGLYREAQRASRGSVILLPTTCGSSEQVCPGRWGLGRDQVPGVLSVYLGVGSGE